MNVTIITLSLIIFLFGKRRSFGRIFLPAGEGGGLMELQRGYQDDGHNCGAFCCEVCWCFSLQILFF